MNILKVKEYLIYEIEMVNNVFKVFVSFIHRKIKNAGVCRKSSQSNVRYGKFDHRFKFK